MTELPNPKPVVWVGPSRRELKTLPRAVRRRMGIALFYAQMGGVHPAARPMKGPALGGVMEIVEDFDRSTYRAMYTTKLGDVVYVLCAFQKKSTHGIRTPQHLVAVIVERLKQARALHAARQEEP